ncbi:MAG: hypothetical protein IT393_10935 [Nitrospirae bacterium]|nr:hypothetical protein [Nitrospirota bacterium]
MNLQSKLYQMIISRLDGDRICEHEYQDSIADLVREGIGGFIIFGGNKGELTPFIERLQSIAAIPLFIASDIERGVGQQVKGYTDFPCQMAVRAAVNRDEPVDMALLREAVKAVGLEAIDAGINMPLIPVLDVNSNPDNPIICTRSFSDDPEDVAFFGAEYIRVLEGLNLISCAKHFPGHGDTSTDSHISLPVIKKSYDELLKFDARPFAEAVKTGVSSIMAGHLLIPSVDDSNPSSLSKKIITGMLRSELGFNGLIMTDALNMSAISGIENAVAKCLNAGVDILLHPSDAGQTVTELSEAVRLNLLSEKTIDTAMDRILKTKQRLSQIKRVEIDLPRHAGISSRITEMSVTLIPAAGGQVLHSGILVKCQNARPAPFGVSLMIAGEEEWCDKILWTSRLGPELISGTQVMTGEEIVIIAIFTKVAAWRGSAGIDDKSGKQITGLIKNAGTSIVISFGSPYILSHFSDADILIAAYDVNVNAQEAVIRCLKGEEQFRGRLPVNLS